MPIYTTYIANKPKAKAQELGSCFVYFVMRNRGNNEVAPEQVWLNLWKLDSVTWEAYREYYLIKLKTPEAQKWIEERAQEARIGNILLACYEKDATHCHRRLLAEEIARLFGVEYKGEL